MQNESGFRITPSQRASQKNLNKTTVKLIRTFTGRCHQLKLMITNPSFSLFLQMADYFKETMKKVVEEKSHIRRET